MQPLVSLAPYRMKNNSRRASRRLTWPLSRSGRIMSTKGRILSVTAPSALDAEVLRACQHATRAPREELLTVALARGCRHYAPLWPELVPAEQSGLPHEVLGCALLAGPATPTTFQSIRCGTMVLSDLGNSPDVIAIAAEQLGVCSRVAHITRVALANDNHPEFWERVQAALPSQSIAEQDFLPGVSRLVSETRLSGLGKGPRRVWLRTEYRQ